MFPSKGEVREAIFLYLNLSTVHLHAMSNFLKLHVSLTEVKLKERRNFERFSPDISNRFHAADTVVLQHLQRWINFEIESNGSLSEEPLGKKTVQTSLMVSYTCGLLKYCDCMDDCINHFLHCNRNG